MQEAVRSSVLPVVCLLLHATASAQGSRADMERPPVPKTEVFVEDARWVSAVHGAVPEGALAHGREPDGRPQYICRGWYGSGLHLGKVSPGSTGCAVVSRGQPVTLGGYQVLTEVYTRAERAKKETVVDLVRRRRAEARQNR